MTGFPKGTVVDVEEINDQDWLLLRAISYQGKDNLFEIPPNLYYFRKKRPDVFIFGHTHEAAHTATAAGKGYKNRLINKVIDVWNDGCFIDDQDGRLAHSLLQTINRNPTRK